MSNKYHPSFANLYIGRSQCSGQQALFGSSIKHHDVITLKISPAYESRSLNEDRYYTDPHPYIQIDMSQAQFAQAITSLNMGDGTPVTLRYLNGHQIEPCPYEDKREVFANELDSEMKELSKTFEEASCEATEILSSKKTLSKADKDTILSAFRKVRRLLLDHMPFMYSQFNRQMDKTVSEAKAEVECHIQTRMDDLAAKAMGMEFPNLGVGENNAPEITDSQDENEGMTMGGMG